MRRAPCISSSLPALFCFLLCATAVIKAQGLPDCGFGSGGEFYLIYVDAVEWRGVSEDVNSTIQDKMRFAVRGQIESLNNELVGIQFVDGQSVPLLEPVPCAPRRVPASAVSFDDLEFQSLSRNKVVLEIWASIVDPDTGEGLLSFVLVPARSYTKPAIYDVQLRLGSATQAKNAMPEFLKRTKRLMAYIEMVLGVRLFENGSYAQSITHMCRGIGQLEGALKKETPPPPPAKTIRDQRLIADLKLVVVQAIDQQRQRDPVAGLASTAPKTCPAGGD